MGKTTIKWCDFTHNPWWGMPEGLPRLRSCYAEAMSNRFGKDIWGPYAKREFRERKYSAQPHKWNRDALARASDKRSSARRCRMSSKIAKI